MLSSTGGVWEEGAAAIERAAGQAPRLPPVPSHRGPHRVPSALPSGPSSCPILQSYSSHTYAAVAPVCSGWQMPPLNHASVAAYLIDSASHSLGLRFDAVTDTFADPPATDPPTPPGWLVEDDLSQLSGLPPTERVAAALRRLEIDLSACFSPGAQVRNDDDTSPVSIHCIMRCWP